MINITRGTTVTFSQVFTGANGQPTNPASATLTVVYPTSRKPTSVSIAMALASDNVTWVANWESSAAVHGTVEWTIKSGGNTPFVQTDGCFVLTANGANEPPMRE